MNIKRYILMATALMALVACKEDEPTLDFGLDRSSLEVGYTGARELVKISSSESWIASTDNPWITISPANGKGSVTCEFLIDSALTAQPRTGVVRIQNLVTRTEKEISITQAGYPYSIELSEPEVEVENYGPYGERWFDVKVKTNVDFEVEIPEGIRWIDNEDYDVSFNRGIRPREVTVRFNWDINTISEERLAEITFRPKEEVSLARQDALLVRQNPAEAIVENTREGDSVAVLTISRALNQYTPIDTSAPMHTWDNVQLWDEGMPGYTPDKKGRVRRAEFMLFNIEESLPYAVKFLTAADELYFFGNTNTFMRSLDLGEDILELKQLKRLTVGAYGLTSLPADFKRLESLEYLNLGSNNFQRLPDVLTKENLPNLRTLILNANERSVVYDLSNTTRTDLGGFIEEPEFPAHLLKWNLDTLVLSVNYLQGPLPDFLDDEEVPFYTQEDVDNSRDTLPQFLVGRVKKVMPTTKRFSINHNRLSGEIPEWLLFHPGLNLWYPDILVFPQEGRAQNGIQAGFSNEPANMNYYYDLYTSKEKPSGLEEE